MPGSTVSPKNSPLQQDDQRYSLELSAVLTSWPVGVLMINLQCWKVTNYKYCLYFSTFLGTLALLEYYLFGINLKTNIVMYCY